MDENQKRHISKFLSLILRHKPESIGLKLGNHGWANIAELLELSSLKGKRIKKEDLLEVVKTSDKKRFAIDESQKMIRANQGHSLDIDIDFEERIPPKILFHGSTEKNIPSILENGLRKMERHHVHLSADIETALAVGKRYGKPVVFKIDSEAMLAEGIKFYISENGVWLVDMVPPSFLDLFE